MKLKKKLNLKNIFSFGLCSILLISTASSQTHTNFPGNWNDNSNWENGRPNPNEDAEVYHHMILNTNITINNGTYTIHENGSIIDLPGVPNRRLTVTNDGMLDVDGNVTIEGNFEAGTIHIRDNDTLIVGNTEFISGSNIIIDEFGVLIINGDLNINAGFLQTTTVDCDGLIYVNGDISANSGFLGSVSIEGTGKVQAIGDVSGSGWPAPPNFFGNTNIGCTNNCEYGGGAGLPVELLSFKAENIEKGKIKVEWVTETEINNDYFIVEKSTDGFRFEEIAIVDGAGKSLQRKTYHIFTSAEPVVSYFRLKQIDVNGSEKYYKPIALEPSSIFNQADFVFYPNPIQPNVDLTIYAKNIKPNTLLEIRDVNGKLFFSKKLENELNEIPLKDSFKNGIYLISLINEDGITSKKLIVTQ